MSSTVSPLLRTDLDGVFRPRSVAIYGISERTSQRIAENMTVPGVPFYGVNPTKSEACGVRCYPSMAECPEVPEMVVMGVGHGRIEAAIDDVLSVPGVRAIITPGLGNEAGEAGPAISERIRDRVLDAVVGGHRRADRVRAGAPFAPQRAFGEVHGVGGARADLRVAVDLQQQALGVADDHQMLALVGDALEAVPDQLRGVAQRVVHPARARIAALGHERGGPAPQRIDARGERSPP